MQLNAEEFVDKVLFNYSLVSLNDIFKNIEEGKYKAINLFYYSVPYGLSLKQVQICIEYFLQRIEEILGKPIEQIIKKYGQKKLTELLGSKTSTNLRNEFIVFVENCPVEDRSPNDFYCEKITRLHIAMQNMQDKLFYVFSDKVIKRTYKFFIYIINENKINEINFICNMIYFLSLDNINDNTTTKYVKLVIFLNDFIFRKNNIIKFIDKYFSYSIKTLYEISKGYSNLSLSSTNNYNIYKLEIKNYAKFLLDNLQIILANPIDLNSNEKINELLNPEKLNIFKREAIIFIKDVGPEFYDYNMIKKYKPLISCDYFNNDFFDIETPIYLKEQINSLGKKFLNIEQVKQIVELAYYFHNMIPNNPTQFTNEEIGNVIKYLYEVSKINYDEFAIKSVLNSESAKTLLSKINKTRIETDDLNNFFTEFNNKNPYVMREPIPQQTNLNAHLNAK
mgnify:CR=1 FL=1